MNQYLFPIGTLDQPRFDRMKQTLTELGASTVFVVPSNVSGNRVPFAPDETYRAFLARLTEMAAQLTEIGIEPAVWIPTLGYGGQTNPENQSIAAELTHIQSIDGKVAQDAFCPTDPRFAEIMCRTVADLARTGVRRIMLDDELVLSVRPGLGCACDRHMQQFRRRIGRDIDRASLENALFTGPGNDLRRAWLDLMGGTLRTFCQQLRAAVDAVDPAVRMGFCAGYTSFDAEGVDAFTLTRDLAGHTKPFLRLTGAPYWIPGQRFGRLPMEVVLETVRQQQSWGADSGIELFTEVDTHPRACVHTPAAYVEAFDLATHAAAPTDALKYLFDYNQTPDVEQGYLKAHRRNRPLYEKISQEMDDLQPAGVRIYESMRTLADADLPADYPGVPGVLQRWFHQASLLLAPHAIPTVYSGDGVCGMVCGEHAKYLPESALNHGLILDLQAAQILQRAGVDVGLRDAQPFGNSVQELFDPAVGPRPLYCQCALYRLATAPGAKPQSWFVGNGDPAPAAYRYQNAAGQRFFVLAFSVAEQPYSAGVLLSDERGAQLTAQIPWLSGAAIPTAAEPHPHLYVIWKQQGDRAALAYFNLGADPVEDLTVTLPAPAAARFVIGTGRALDARTIQIDAIAPLGCALVCTTASHQ